MARVCLLIAIHVLSVSAFRTSDELATRSNAAHDEQLEIPEAAHADPWSFADMRLSAWAWHRGSHGHAVSEAALLQEENDDTIWPLDKKQQLPCVRNYSVKFKLEAMHSWFDVPMCSANPNQVWKGCGQCDDGRKGAAEAHWNIPGCTEHMCIWHASGRGADVITIGPEEGLPVHPRCAWGIVKELQAVYKYPYRAAGMGGVTDALGWHVANPATWAKILGGLFSEGGVGLAKGAARSVDWNARLSPNCDWARSKEKILETPPEYQQNGKRTVTPISAVCWNNVIDFRDLWCHYKKQFDVTSETACSTHF
eukprot:TRINITY_DN17166_c0_g1_i1.p1 TRINITY_DN17166_c0_g1~~TRINITY_DN17166_c0_g1_i1.p1  ORF type:complete len:327 (-),score=42.46 TRINITY_DN17166_c0_g1_i1:338-1267(-)